MRELNHAQSQQLASARVDMESQAVAAAELQEVGFRQCISHCALHVHVISPVLPAFHGM
jgi:hypothetical protein